MAPNIFSKTPKKETEYRQEFARHSNDKQELVKMMREQQQREHSLMLMKSQAENKIAEADAK